MLSSLDNAITVIAVLNRQSSMSAAADPHTSNVALAQERSSE